MTDYYKDEDLERFGEIGKYAPDLFKKFIAWCDAALKPGVLSKREKVLIGVAVAHVVQCPYCIDAYTKSCLEEEMSLEHITVPCTRRRRYGEGLHSYTEYRRTMLPKES